MSSSMSAQMPSGPPYPPRGAGIGGVPTVGLDVPISAVFILLFLGSAAGHQAIFQMNRRKGHKFIVSLALFGFSMARIVTCALRIAWSVHQHNVSLAIAANILVSAGILIIYVVNLVLTQRILRATHPEIGWHRMGSIIPRIIYGLVGLALALVISFTVLTFYTLDQHLLNIARDVQLAALTYLLIITLIPIVLLPFGFFKSRDARDFGEGSMTTKILILSVSSLLCLVEQIFRTATSWEAPRPMNDPAWYHSKAAFYCFNFTIEIIIVYFLLLTRIDKRFYIPDGASKRRHYQATAEKEAESSSVV